MDMQQTVTVSVTTYNSSKFVLETLESIKDQTYPNLILHVCDDCSTDNTVAICREWIEKNKDRFVSTDIIIPDYNTGVSGNCNRAWDACTTEYNKDIAGDDILLPTCIEDNMKYVTEHPEAVIVFSKVDIFGPDPRKIVFFENFFDYSFFDLSVESQYEKLISTDNCIPAPSTFMNIIKAREYGIRHDERIPLLEDLPKWINITKKGIKLHFFDKVTTKYRVGESGLSSGSGNFGFRRSRRLYDILYIIDYQLSREKELALKNIIEYEMSLFDEIERKSNEQQQLLCSKRMRIINYIINCVLKIKQFMK